MSERLHLLEVGVRWPPETFVRAKLERLAAAGVRVTVASPLAPGASRSPLPGLELLVLTHWSTRRIRKLLGVIVMATRAPRSTLALVRAIRRSHGHAGNLSPWRTVAVLWLLLPLASQRPDVVQFEWETAAARYLPLLELWGCPVVMACRGGDVSVVPHLPAERWDERIVPALRRATAVHCVSEATAREAQEHGLDPARARVIRTAVDLERFCPNGGPPADAAELRVVSVGSLRWRKDHETALRALACLTRAGVPARLEIIGSDPAAETEEESQRDRLLFTGWDLGLAGRVDLVAGAEPADVRDRLRRAHVLLHTGLAEGIPNVLVEAMACAVAVVTADSGGVREAVTDGVEGFVVAPRDAHAMAIRLERLWRDPGLRERMGHAGRERCAAAFAPARQVEEFLALYRWVTAA